MGTFSWYSTNLRPSRAAPARCGTPFPCSETAPEDDARTLLVQQCSLGTLTTLHFYSTYPATW